VLGWLFKFQTESDDKNELLIFLTPRIVQLQQKRVS
jgi:type IV pilus assembly protein PilQ